MWTPREELRYKSSTSVYRPCVDGIYRMKTSYALLLEPLFEAHEFLATSWASFQMRRRFMIILSAQIKAAASIPWT